jgi:streptogramin lyase
VRARGRIGLALALCLLVFTAAANARPLGEITTFPVPSPSKELWGITRGADGNMWFADNSTKSVGRITVQGQISEFPVNDPAHPNHGPSAEITQGPDHNIWFADQNGAVGRTNPQGQSTIYPVGGGSLPNDWIWGVAPGSDGNVWFSNRGCQGNPGGTCAIGKITPGGVIKQYTAFPLSGAKPSDMALGADGNVWFVDYGASAIGKVTPAGQIIEYSLSPSAEPGSVGLGPNGNVWFTEFGTRRIGEITPQGHITEFSAGIPSTALLGAIATGADGNIWFVDYGMPPAIGRITPQGQVAEYPTGLPKKSGPSYIAAGSDGSMWVTNNVDAGNPDASTAIERIGTGYPPIPSQRPVLSGLRVSPKKSSIAGRRVKGRCVKRTAKNRAHKRCRRAIKLRIGFTLNTVATVTLTFTKQKSGRRVKKGCVKRTGKNRKHTRCTRNVRLPGQITLSAKAGTNTFTFAGKTGGRRLGPGRYRLTVTPAGGTPQTAQFRVVG